jgi:transposase
VDAFPAQAAARWQELARQHAHPLKLWVMDESRFGLQTIQRRRITLRGIKPLGAYQHRFENFYLYGAACPLTGEGEFAVARRMNQATFISFIQAIATAQPDVHHVFLLDNSATHRLDESQRPDNVTLLFQPPYAPELNPIERVWQEAKRALAWRNFTNLFDLQDAVAEIFTAFSPDDLISLTAADYLIQIIRPIYEAGASPILPAAA